MTKTIIHFFLVILTLSGLSLQAQKRILYNLQVTYPDGLKKNSTVYLDINNDKTDFYEARFITPGQKPSGPVQAIERKSGTSENTILVQDFKLNSFKIKTTDILDWKLMNDYKTVEKYKLQKATVLFGGRNWNVWFCNEIPLAEGPYKFNGLPGLVFEAEDMDGVFKYSLMKIENLSKSSVQPTLNVKNAINITWEKYNKLLSDFYENPYQKERESAQKGNEIVYEDKEMKVQDFTKMTKDFQTMIRKNLPPYVEADKNFLLNKTN
ncbi:GLPGLI family protein [Elizabethkingia occulta]|uniref:GLPGLI family protein n=1 Tax=Elizabethkingia occulta TaxID=1867263 RepID=UPI00099A201F|nr:GLPGLI family protein [Elizabethkingia occulta]OPB86379.1 ABC transporter substrate-binding protein [Elizabethkingia occulta]